MLIEHPQITGLADGRRAEVGLGEDVCVISRADAWRLEQDIDLGCLEPSELDREVDCTEVCKLLRQQLGIEI